MRIAWGLAMLALLAIGGCGVFERNTPEGASTAATPAKTTAEDLLAYVARLRGSSDSVLAAEAARQRRDGGDAARVKAALALSLAVQSDDGEIAALVDPVARKPAADPSLRAMAAFVQALAAERRRLKENAAAAQGRLKDERKLAELQKQRADTLQQKLDALTELEKSLADREAAPAR